MAIVRPYGDPNAHGSLNNSLTFRRYKNKVILQSLPRPRITYTPAQLTQRAKVTAGNKAYSLLTNATKFFYYKRAIQKATTRKGLFMHAHMRNFLPSTLRPIHCKSIEDMVIFNTAGFYPDNVEITIYNQPYSLPPEPAASCILWNQLQDTDLISQIGTNGTNQGLSFVPGVWDDCGRANAVGERAKFLNISINLNEHIMEFYINTDFDLINGIPSDGEHHLIIDVPIAGTNPLNGRFLLYIHKTLGIIMYSTISGTFDCIDNTTSWTAGTWHRFFCIISRSASFDGDKTQAIYVDNVETASSEQTFADQEDRNYDVCIENAARNWSIWNQLDGEMDNLKIYQYPTPALLEGILANDQEGWPTIWDLTKYYGVVLDNSNVYTKLQEVETYALQVINLSTPGGNRIIIPFRYLISIQWLDENDILTHSEIRLPQLTIEALQSVELFLSRDWSVYWDKDFKRLACASRL